MIHQIHTERLTLRQWQSSDLKACYQMNSDREVMRYFPSLLTNTESDQLVEKFKRALIQQGWGIWALEYHGDDKALNESVFIGFVGLQKTKVLSDPSQPNGETIEIVWRLRKEYWHQGFAYEAAQAVLDFAFNTLKLAEVISFTSLNNTASIKLMARLGMVNTQRNFNHPAIDQRSPLSEHVLYQIKAPSN